MKYKLLSSVVAATLACSIIAGTSLSEARAANSAKPVAKKYLVAFQHDLPNNYSEAIAKAGGKVARALPEIGSLEVESSNDAFLSNIKSISNVQAANLEMKHQLDYKKNDPAAADGQPVTDIPQPENIDSYWDYQWDIHNVTNDGASYDIQKGSGAVVGVIDTGIDLNHPDLKGNLLGGENFVPVGAFGDDTTETGDPNDYLDRDGHGTHVAGSIAGNGKVQGVGPELGIRAYRVFPANAGAATSWIADAIIQAADDGVDVINMSIGGFDALSRYTYQHSGSYSDVADMLVWKRAIQYAVKKNVTVVVAAGNESLNLNNPTEITDYMNATYGELGYQFKGASIEVPGQLPGVVTVSSSNKWSTDQIAFYSNYGSRSIDVAAPGGDNGPLYHDTRDLKLRDFHYRTLSTWPTYMAPYITSNLHSYALLHGTSMASPKVSGIAGVIKAAHPELSPAQVTALIKQTAIDYGKNGKDPLYGSGEANIYNALTR
ncbi:peptidase [Bacillus canaveralius]|uniref:Peptidase n=1 Tax=Bacillus canaveralius TaxID=1403243 RepID=A0A2N5GGH2_9BACI|nr:S8 family serine peptidase [Bacillus canaveralius]PLR79846.1 peptidase [Bacillus canaveralius]PLR97805.1 peptidase [Bacillus canaveralius]RSK45556.1 peptidase [Bacillus canaveralius]